MGRRGWISLTATPCAPDTQGRRLEEQQDTGSDENRPAEAISEGVS
jgi:hypothetical protein